MKTRHTVKIFNSKTWGISVAVPHYFNADPDPTFHSAADPDPTFQFDPDYHSLSPPFGPSNAPK